MNNLIPVSFRKDELYLVNHDGQPYTAMRPIVEGMGLDWKSQHTKLKERFNSVVVEMTTTGSDGKRYKMTCMPLRKLPAWLYTVHPNKVRPEIRETIIAYQNECDDVLWAYWNDGTAINPRASNDALKAASIEFTGMTDAVMLTRLEQGKDIKPYHYSNEALLINKVVFGIRAAVDRKAITDEQARLVTMIERRNGILYAQGKTTDERKVLLSAYRDSLTARLGGGDGERS